MENDSMNLQNTKGFPLVRGQFLMENDLRAYRKDILFTLKSRVFQWKWLFASGNSPKIFGKKQWVYINILSTTEKIPKIDSKYVSSFKPFYKTTGDFDHLPYNVDIHTTHISKIPEKRYPPKISSITEPRKNLAGKKFSTSADFLLIKKIKRIIFLCYLLEIKSIYSFLQVVRAGFTPLTFFENRKMWVVWISTFLGRFI